MGQAQGGMHLVEKPSDVDNLAILNPSKVAYVSQTTLSVDDTQIIIKELRKKYPKIQGPRKNDICYATQNRQDAVKVLSSKCDVVLVVGSTNSSNSNRLRELAEQKGIKGYLIDNADQINKVWLGEDSVVGVTAGASAPEILVQEVVQRLIDWGATQVVEEVTKPENVSFALPLELR